MKHRLENCKATSACLQERRAHLAAWRNMPYADSPVAAASRELFAAAVPREPVDLRCMGVMPGRSDQYLSTGK